MNESSLLENGIERQCVEAGPLSTGTTDAVNFLRSADPSGWHNLVAIDPDTRKLQGRTFAPDSWDAVDEWIRDRNGRVNLYWSVNEPRPGAPNVKLLKTDIVSIRFLYGDLDPADGVPLDIAREHVAAAAARLATGPLPPSITLDSGGGFQFFWRLREKLAATDHQTWAEQEGRGLAHMIDGDAVQDINRIMRLPGTINLPDEKKRDRGRIARQANVVTQTNRSYEQREVEAFVAPVAAASYEDRDAAVATARAAIDMRAVEACQAGEDLPFETRKKFERASAVDWKLRALWHQGKASGDTSASGHLASLAAAVAPHDFDATDFATLAATWDRTNDEKSLSARSLARAWGRVGELLTPSCIAQRYFEAGAAADPLFPADAPIQAQRRFEFITLGDAARGALTASAKPLIKGLLDQGAMSVLYGESNVGKTFVAMDLSHHVASGKPWAGMRTAALSVLYVAAEGGGGAKKRAAALLNKYGDADGRFRLLLSPINLLHPDADMAPFLARLRELPEQPGLIVIDTLSRAMAGGDENSSVDMGSLVRNLDRLRDASSAHLLIVHHTGKDRAKGARGHSLLRAAVDTEIEVEKGVISVTKQRDLDKSWSSSFELDPTCLGVDEDGAPITSCTVRLVGGTPTRIEVPTEGEQQVLNALEDIQEAGGDSWTSATTSEIAARLVRAGGPEITSEALRARLRQLDSKRLVVKLARGRWSPNAVEKASATHQNDNLSDSLFPEAVDRPVAGVFS